MIEMPQRSVTRFFIPLIDVLTLLFCIYLLMPVVEGTGEPAKDSAADARGALGEKERLELAALRQKVKDLEQPGRAA